MFLFSEVHNISPSLAEAQPEFEISTSNFHESF